MDNVLDLNQAIVSSSPTGPEYILQQNQKRSKKNTKWLCHTVFDLHAKG